MDYNIYLWNNGIVTQVTDDGSEAWFNGIPDWVYEEEELEGRSAMWFSPDGKYLAFLSFDDTAVPEITVPHYFGNSNNLYVQPYPREEKIRYPKAGFPNPKIRAKVFDVTTPKKLIEIPLTTAFNIQELVLGEVAWVTDDHDQLLIRCFNREQNQDKHILFRPETSATTIVRERKEDNGWIDNTKSIKYVGNITGLTGRYYVDLSDEDGWSHIYLYDTAGSKPKQITKGQWEVRSIDKVNLKTGEVYFASTERHPTESHLYSVSLVTGKKKALVDDSTAGYWQATYSSSGDYSLLNYLGPDVPDQIMTMTNDLSKRVPAIADVNKVLKKELKNYDLPVIRYLDLQHPNGYNLSTMLRFPPTFDQNKKYPVLFTPYGGPGAQDVDKKFIAMDWKMYITSDEDLEYVTYTVDNRGTGFRGRAFRQAYYKAQGQVDVEDQIWAARRLIEENPWVDTEHVGIWGWSNGGYLAAKVIEANSGLFTFAMSTAPSADDTLYDSIYSERYLGMPANSTVYDRSAIRNATGFKNLPGGYLLQHGTADDNVHFQHSLSIMSNLMVQGVPPEKFQIQPFVDSEHNMLYRNDHSFLYRQLTQWLFKEKHRKPEGERERHQWQDYSPVRYQCEAERKLRLQAAGRVNMVEQGRPWSQSRYRVMGEIGDDDDCGDSGQ
jgi:dipeptidyl-peptidase-4